MSVRREWGERLRSLAEPVLAGTPLVVAGPEGAARRWIDEFRDERGHRRVVDRPLLVHMLGLHEPVVSETGRTDLRLWRMLASGGGDPLGTVAPGDGPLSPDFDSMTIETATETELASLHAMFWLARGRPEAMERASRAAAWFAQNLQPDNATNHAWASHVFIGLWLETGNTEMRMLGETLIHNAIVATGKPGKFSAVLLLDSARAIDA